MRFLGLLVENAAVSDAREQRRLSELEHLQERARSLESLATAREAESARRMEEAEARYEVIIMAANARADSMVSPATVTILQDEIVQLHQMLTDAGSRTDRLVGQLHEIAMKPAPAPATLMGSLGDVTGMQVAHPLDGFPRTQAALRMLSVGQSRPNREAMLATAVKYKVAGNLKDEQIEKLLHQGEGYRE